MDAEALTAAMIAGEEDFKWTCRCGHLNAHRIAHLMSVTCGGCGVVVRIGYQPSAS